MAISRKSGRATLNRVVKEGVFVAMISDLKPRASHAKVQGELSGQEGSKFKVPEASVTQRE